MPIRPENRDRYPPDWPQVRERILQRARHRCEWPGCSAPHRRLGYWWKDDFVLLPRALADAGVDKPCVIQTSEGYELKIILLVLTIAHLDHTPEHCSDENLRAWCQRHHLAYDIEHHRQTAYATRRAGRACGDLFVDLSTSPAATSGR